MKKLFTGILAVATVVALASAANAETLDLQHIGASGDLVGAVGGTALFEQGKTGSGTGIFPAFVQIAGNDPVHDAYNTTVNNVLDNGASSTFNHEIQLQDVATVTRSGVSYYLFVLDVNESNNSSDRYLSLDELAVVTSTTPNQSDETPEPFNPDDLGDLRWQMADGDRILLDFDLEPGSGFGDMRFLVPTSAFEADDQDKFVYLYSLFGAAGTTCAGLTGPVTGYVGATGCVAGANYGTSDGFEEWAYNLTPGTIIPDGGSTLGLLGLAMLGVGYLRRRML
jgi:hypothetical protein